MEEMWLARDKDDSLYIYDKKPYRNIFIDQWKNSFGWFESLPKEKFPEIQWEDEEPTKVKLIIDK